MGTEKTLEERKVEALEDIAIYLGHLADCVYEGEHGIHYFNTEEPPYD